MPWYFAAPPGAGPRPARKLVGSRSDRSPATNRRAADRRPRAASCARAGASRVGKGWNALTEKRKTPPTGRATPKRRARKSSEQAPEETAEAATGQPETDATSDTPAPRRRRSARSAEASDEAPAPPARRTSRRRPKSEAVEPPLSISDSAPAADDDEAPESSGPGLDPSALAGVTAELEAVSDTAGLWDDDASDADDPLDFILDEGPVLDPSDPIQVAAARIGITRLHREQRRVIDSVLAGRDVLMILPTGFGKSACYQIPSMVLPKPVLVISPLLALMRDQYEKLEKHQIPVVRLDGTVRGKHRKAALERIGQGGSLLVMTTPETLATEDAVSALGKSGVSLAAIDEAHCISEWGYDFRPTYLQLGERLRLLGAPPVLALTATATEKVRTAIIRFVGMRDPEVVASSPHRSNLAFDVLRCSGDQRLRAMMRLVLRLRRPGIIYCSTTREVDEIYALLRRFGAPAHRYHGKMSGSEREKEQDAYMRRGRRTVMVATNAFGLGVDKQDIRYVLHYQSPASLEQYVQEAGRAGRDGRRSNCILLYSPEDRLVHEALLARSRIRPEQLYKLARALAGWAGEGKVPTLAALALSADLGVKIAGALLAVLEEATLVKWDQTAVYVTVGADEIEAEARKLAGQFETLRSQDARRLDSVAAYAGATGCRAVFLREYFGEEGSDPCGMCDVCRGASERPSVFYEPLEAPRNAPRRGDRRGRVGARVSRGGERGRGGRQGGRGGPRPGALEGGRHERRPFGPRPFAERADASAPAPGGQGPEAGRRRRRRGRRRGRRRDEAGVTPESVAPARNGGEAARERHWTPQRSAPFAPDASPEGAGALGGDGQPRNSRRRRRRRGRGRRGRGGGNGSLPEGSAPPGGGDHTDSPT